MAKQFTLSPSRAKDYKQCPLMYKYKVIDKLPTKPSIEALRGTHIHSILENLFYKAASERTLENAISMIEPKWSETLQNNPNYRAEIPEVAKIEADNAQKQKYMEEVRERLENYFRLENPAILTNVTGQELWISTTLDYKSELTPTGLRIGGFIDRLEEVDGAGARISDYKTGKTPAQNFQEDALYQMYFYSLCWAKNKGELPKQVKLLYLKDGGAIVKMPTQDILDQLEAEILALWGDIENSMQTNTWEAKVGPLCPWCNFNDICEKYYTSQKKGV